MLTERIDVTAAELQPGDYPVRQHGARVKQLVVRRNGDVIVVLSKRGWRTNRRIEIRGTARVQVSRPIPKSRQKMNALIRAAEAEETTQ